MPWTTPRTWVQGDMVTVGRLNADLRDNMLYLNTTLGARVRGSSPVSIPNNSQTLVSAYWDTEDWDSDTMHSLTSLQARLTIRTAGKYSVHCTILWQAGGTNATQKRLHIYHTRAGVDTEVARQQERGVGAADSNCLNAEGMVDCLVGDYLRCEVFQDSGGALNITTTQQTAPFKAHRVGN